jgi:hypothetical protein
VAAPSAGCRLDGSKDVFLEKPERLLFSFGESGEGLDILALSVSCCRLRLEEDFELVLKGGMRSPFRVPLERWLLLFFLTGSRSLMVETSFRVLVVLAFACDV